MKTYFIQLQLLLVIIYSCTSVQRLGTSHGGLKLLKTTLMNT